MSAAIAAPGDQDNPKTVIADTGYLENVLLEKLPGKERIALVVSAQPAISVGNQTDGNLLIKLENMYVPENLRRSFGENALSNISRVIPQQKLMDGKQWAYLTIDINEAVPYAVKQEGKNIYIDFNVSGLPEKRKRVVTASSSGRLQPVKKEVMTNSTDKLVTLDFQDADIKSVLRLMAEYGNMSIVSGDDVKGNVTLTMRNVPWEQALDTILDVNGLAKKKMGNVISIMTLDKKKKDESDKAKAEEDQRRAEDQRKDRELKLMVEKGLLKQILIEAKIVEATENFTRNLGVQWGIGTNQGVSGGRYGLGISAGSSNSISRQYSQTYPSQIPWYTTDGTQLAMGAVNFPSLATTAVSPALGVVFGGANAFLEVQLAALEETSTGKIISAPKIVTMEGVKATIKQGSEIPYVTPASGTSPATISFKEALLKLEVTPKITDEGKISMEIKANNDQPDYVNMIVGTTNPPIKKSERDSKVVVQNGDTVVIGGIVKTNDNKTVSGLPWLQKIPVLGWLFKTENIDKEKTQLLIFITPKILQGTDFVGTLGRNNN
ncbi:MAG: secretin and TonB N-terminal domain-containing protein [Smithellaceae bacterium]